MYIQFTLHWFQVFSCKFDSTIFEKINVFLINSILGFISDNTKDMAITGKVAVNQWN